MKSIIDILGAQGLVSFAQFMRIALYEPELGYYANPARKRVGTSKDADFYTSESMGRVFAELVAGACRELVEPCVGEGVTFVELGAEAGASNVASQACPPFEKSLALSLGAEIPDSGNLLLFSNELFDAQPFNRVVRFGGCWRESGVRIVDGQAVEELLPELTPEVAAFAPRLPEDAPEGYRMDLPLQAEALMADLARRENVCAIVAFDYGLDWADILHRRPAGTARAYRSHSLCGSLFDAPGEQDLTCHICWDGLENVLRDAGFSDVRLMRQESFFMRHAMPQIEAVMSRGDIVEAGKLRELVHPTRMGAAFQVLVALR
ncbi:MAG: SAM-dependent methyltransferase [Opitutales bacterium]|nr:SAM-dependent methyltransferase [Opitutales bacterium]